MNVISLTVAPFTDITGICCAPAPPLNTNESPFQSLVDSPIEFAVVNAPVHVTTAVLAVMVWLVTAEPVQAAEVAEQDIALEPSVSVRVLAFP